MNYHYCYRIKGFDLWQLYMYYIYGSLAGVCNIIFTIAMIVLTWSKWSQMAGYWHIILIFACIFFPLIQPLMVYWRAKKEAVRITQDTEISFYNKGIKIKVGEQTSELKWDRIKGILKKPTMLILLSEAKHGYVLPNRILGNEKEEFYSYVNSWITPNET